MDPISALLVLGMAAIGADMATKSARRARCVGLESALGMSMKEDQEVSPSLPDEAPDIEESLWTLFGFPRRRVDFSFMGRKPSVDGIKTVLIEQMHASFVGRKPPFLMHIGQHLEDGSILGYLYTSLGNIEVELDILGHDIDMLAENMSSRSMYSDDLEQCIREALHRLPSKNDQILFAELYEDVYNDRFSDALKQLGDLFEELEREASDERQRFDLHEIVADCEDEVEKYYQSQEEDEEEEEEDDWEEEDEEW